ncbi:GTPase-activating protein [Kickxella alabastrina]|nr:GTPase-activating protein [Kickxella alabastrina]
MTAEAAPVKKSLRSKRLMRPAAANANSTKAASDAPPPPPPPPIPSLDFNTEEIPPMPTFTKATPSPADTHGNRKPMSTDETEYQHSATDTETLFASATTERHRSPSAASTTGSFKSLSRENASPRLSSSAAATPRSRTGSFGSVGGRSFKDDESARIMDFENVDLRAADLQALSRRSSKARRASFRSIDGRSPVILGTQGDEFGAPQGMDAFEFGVPLIADEGSGFANMPDVPQIPLAFVEEAPRKDAVKEEQQPEASSYEPAYASGQVPASDFNYPAPAFDFNQDHAHEPKSDSNDEPKNDFNDKFKNDFNGEFKNDFNDNLETPAIHSATPIIDPTVAKMHTIPHDQADNTHSSDSLARLDSHTNPMLQIPSISSAALESVHDTLGSMTETANGSGNSAKEYALGRSVSMRYGNGNAATGAGGTGRRRPSLAVSSKAKNRRSIMLTSFVPPVGMSGGPNTGSPSRLSVESQSSALSALSALSGIAAAAPTAAAAAANADTISAESSAVDISIGGKTFQRTSLLDGSAQQQQQVRRSNRISPEMGMSAIRLRPSSEVAAADALTPENDKPVAKTALQSIGERIGSAVGVIKEETAEPEWLKEVQRRKREALEKEEVERATIAAVAAERAAITAVTTADATAVAAAAAAAASAAAFVSTETTPPKVPQKPKLKLAGHAADEDSLPLTDINLTPRNEVVAWPTMDTEKPLPSMSAPPEAGGSATGTTPAPPARSIYRSLSASLGMGNSAAFAPSAAPQSGPPLLAVSERQRATSQSDMSPTPNQNSLFAAVSSFFGRASTPQPAPPPAQPAPATVAQPAPVASADSRGILEFPGMRPSQSDAQHTPVSAAESQTASDPAMDELLHQLEAQNQQILKDNKARVFTRETLVEDEPVDDFNSEGNADWDFWGNLINNYDRVSKTEPRKLARSVHIGIPKAIRGTVWQLMTCSRSDPALNLAFRKLVAQPLSDDSEEEAKHEKQIRHDLARTFPKLDYFRDASGAGQEGLYSVLRAYALYDPEVGYCQGLSFVVGPLLLNMPDEEAFCVLARLMFTYGLRGHFLPSMDDLQLRLFQFDHVLRETLPRLSRHFQQQGVEPTMYVSQWLMTMFAYRLPIELTFRLFDVVFAEGLDALLRVAISVLKRSQTRLLSLQFEAILQYLNDGPLFAFYSHASPDMLVRDANLVTAVTPRMLEKLRRRYIEEMERKIEEEEEGNRVRTENEALRLETAQLKQTLQSMGSEYTELSTAYAAMQSEARQQKEDGDRLRQTVVELEGQLKGERKSAEEQLREDMGLLAQKNVALVVKNQQLEDSLQDMESALIQIKILYAESENQREVLFKQFDDLRKALK